MIVEEWRPFHRHLVVGVARVRMDSGMVIHDVLVSERNGLRWASVSPKPLLGALGSQLRDANGAGLFRPVITFATPLARNEFSAAVVEAVAAAFPEAWL
jgi:hypothetical protein